MPDSVTPVTALPYQLSYYLNDLFQQCEEQGEIDIYEQISNHQSGLFYKSRLWRQVMVIMYRKLQINHCIIAIRQFDCGENMQPNIYLYKKKTKYLLLC